jgi:hypothetical protein
MTKHKRASMPHPAAPQKDPQAAAFAGPFVSGASLTIDDVAYAAQHGDSGILNTICKDSNNYGRNDDTQAHINGLINAVWGQGGTLPAPSAGYAPPQALVDAVKAYAEFQAVNDPTGHRHKH